MPLITKSYTFTNGIASDATQVNQDLDTLYNIINGGLDAVNLAVNGINDPTKIATETVTQAKTKGVIYSQDLYSQSWVVSGGVTTPSGSPANQVTVTTLIANILQADGSYRHVTVAGTTYVTGIINATYYLELQPDGTMNWAQTHSVQSGYMPIATVTSDASGNILVITDNRITDPKLKGTLNNTIYSLQRQVAYLTMLSALYSRVDGASVYWGDLMDGLNQTNGKIDNTKTNSTGTIPISAGTIVVPVLATTGFTVGQEVTIFDDVNLERRIITAINAGVSLSFAAMTNSYKIKAQICRSSVIQDTVNHLLKFNGWSVFTTNTAVSVVGAAYDTSGNNGDKLVQTANGNWIIIEVNGTTIQVQRSIDGGVSYQALCTITGAQVGAAIAWNGGNNVTILWNTTTIVYSNTFDVTTVTNTDQNANKVIVDNSITSVFNNVSIKCGSDGKPTATWSCVHATLPNSKNIRSAKASTTAVTAWNKQDGTAGVDQVTVGNTSGQDTTNPCVVVQANNKPVITAQFSNTGTTLYYIVSYSFVSAWGSQVIIYTSTATYTQSNPCARVAPSGRIWCVWRGLDATDTTKYNIRYSYSDDGGATWLTAVKLTNGNVYDQLMPTLSIDKSNNVYVLWHGNDAAGGSFYNIFRNIWTGTAFQGVTKLITNTTGNAQDPSAIDNNTMDFGLLTPPMIYKDSQAVAVKFSGTVGTLTPVLVEDVRYNINPPANVSSCVAWVDHDADPNYSIAGAVSFQAGGGTESFSTMTKTTAAVDGTHNEDQFTGSGTGAAKATLRLTLTRNSTSLVKNIESIMGAVGA